ncbi:cytochrome b561 and DOMON domain-containing protein At3g61750-like [Asparagus officinalis]|uniref:cytochrome b561 and DOMON domain-containing protein At3g61750-like n=1 Tax=Asparagus officinalis TaxID=4686 RepID=UPI00098E5575|nr:cytochrome b561 and DOMON domain-containing protein At3g61750-like [Asparagus officinalis]
MALASFSLLLLLVVVVPSSVLISTVDSQTDGCSVDPSSVLPSAFTAAGLSCRPVWNNFILRYSQDENHVLTIVLSTVYTLGWVGIGFSKDGMMTGSSAMVGWIGKTGIPHIKQFYLRGRSSSEVVANEGKLSTTNIAPVVVVYKANIYVAFQLNFSTAVTTQNLLFAFGSSIPVNNRLKEHNDKTSISFDFSSGTSSASSYPYQLKRTHGILNIIGWGVLLPIGAMVARYFKRSDPLWYYIHAIVQLIGFIIGLAGVVAGVALYNKLHADVSAHRGLGIFILVLGILQVIAFFLRPDKDSKFRRLWNWYHHGVGRLNLLLSVVNIYLGIHVGSAGTSWKIGYGINLSVLLLTGVVLEIFLWTRWSQKTSIPPTF